MAELISVLIATKDRPDDLVPCLTSLFAQEYKTFEVIVLDQSVTDATQTAVEEEFGPEPRLRFLRTSEVGKSRALNRLLSEARGALLAFTDDDTDMPENWLSTIVDVFAVESNADIVFGQVHSWKFSTEHEEAHTPALYFDAKRWLRPGEIFGMGANMAMRRSMAVRIGEFDVHLGPGAPLPAAEEGDFIYRAHRIGAQILLEPKLTLIHRAWRSSERWTKVLFGYGMGDAAFAVKHLRCGDVKMIGRISYGIFYMGARGALRVVQRRNFRNEFSYVRGFLRGLVISCGMRVDRRLRLFVTDADNPSGDSGTGDSMRARTAARKAPVREAIL